MPTLVVFSLLLTLVHQSEGVRDNDGQDAGRHQQDAETLKEKMVQKITLTSSPTNGAEDLLCGLEGSEATKLESCATLCRSAILTIPQPGFPHDFFGGLGTSDRNRGEFSTGEGVAALDVEVLGDKTVKLKSVHETFVYPLEMPAYFTCYRRDKLPIFSAWVVDPELLKGDKKARVGSFGTPSRDSVAYQTMHGLMKKEYLRSGDVKGVWSDYYGFDQGHWAPDAPFRKVKELVASTYYFVNVSPQTSCLNRGNWEKLEASIREFAEKENKLAAVMAGPLDKFPAVFADEVHERRKWNDLLDLWAEASDVLMVNDLGKNPHWIEVVTDETRCVTLGAQSPGTARMETKFADLAEAPECVMSAVANNLANGDVATSVFLMTEAGSTGTRRGVRVPLAYWKAVSWDDDATGKLYCCWFFDQTDAVKAVGGQCKNLVSEHHADVVPASMQYAGDAACGQLFTPSEDHGLECDFHTRGIGWRGQFELGLGHAGPRGAGHSGADDKEEDDHGIFDEADE